MVSKQTCVFRRKTPRLPPPSPSRPAPLSSEHEHRTAGAPEGTAKPRVLWLSLTFSTKHHTACVGLMFPSPTPSTSCRGGPRCPGPCTGRGAERRPGTEELSKPTEVTTGRVSTTAARPLPRGTRLRPPAPRSFPGCERTRADTH